MSNLTAQVKQQGEVSVIQLAGYLEIARDHSGSTRIPQKNSGI